MNHVSQCYRTWKSKPTGVKLLPLTFLEHLLFAVFEMPWVLRQKPLLMVKVKVKSLSCVTLCSPMDCSLPGFSVHRIFQARVLEWVAIPFSRRSSWPRDWTQVSRIVGRRFTVWATREVYCGALTFSSTFISCHSLMILESRYNYYCIHSQ